MGLLSDVPFNESVRHCHSRSEHKDKRSRRGNATVKTPYKNTRGVGLMCMCVWVRNDWTVRTGICRVTES